ncbi:MAG: response regulator [Armatimonadetes bacterium]|nr:response regulator [Armatimonadota bacterium]
MMVRAETEKSHGRRRAARLFGRERLRGGLARRAEAANRRGASGRELLDEAGIRLSGVVRAAAFLLLVLGGSCFALWLLGQPERTAVASHWIPMAPNTAFCFVLLGLSLLLLEQAWPARLCSVAVLLLTGLHLMEALGHWDLKVDDWLLQGPEGFLGRSPIGVMAVPTATGLFFVACGTLASTYRTARGGLRVAFGASSVSLGLALTFLLAYVYGAPLMYGSATVPMALVTAVGLALASLGVLGDAATRLRRERRGFLRAIRELNQDLASLADRNLDGLLLTDRAGQVLYANRSAEALLGSPLDADQLARLPLVPGPPGEVERDGKVLEVRCEVTAWRQQSALLICVRDVTARREAERELESRREQLLSAQKMEAVGRLAASVAHDFNNILTAILGYTDLLGQESNLSKMARLRLKEVARAAQKASEITRQLLTYSRHTACCEEVVDLNEVVRSAAGMMQQLMGDQVLLRRELSSEPVYVKADASRLEQVLVNLVLNARDASPEGSEVVVGVYHDGQHAGGLNCCFSVTDQGEGVLPELHEKIFEPFFSTKERGVGTGLGLAICRMVVEHLQGALRLSSAPGHGRTFTVALPPTADRPVANAVVDKAAGGRESILVVEDEEPLLRLLVAVLSRQGFRVHAAADPAQAEQLWRRHDDIQLLISDYNLAGVSGELLVQKLTRERQHVPAILMSGCLPPRSGDSLGWRFLQKPFSPEVFLGAVRQTLRSDCTG